MSSPSDAAEILSEKMKTKDNHSDDETAGADHSDYERRSSMTKIEAKATDNTFTDVSFLLNEGENATKSPLAKNDLNALNPFSFAATAGIASVSGISNMAHSISIPPFQRETSKPASPRESSKQASSLSTRPTNVHAAPHRAPSPERWPEQSKEEQIAALTDALNALQSQHTMVVEELEEQRRFADELRKDLKRSATRSILHLICRLHVIL